MALDTTKYKDIRAERPTIRNKRIELIVFNNTTPLDRVFTFNEYTGALDTASLQHVKFVEGTPEQPRLFHRIVRLEGESSLSTPPTEYTVRLFHLFYTYMWRYIDADEPATALDVSSPTKAGKSSRRKYRRPSRPSRRPSRRSNKGAGSAPRK